MRIVLALLVSLVSGISAADDRLILDAKKVKCTVEPVGKTGYFSGNISYDDLKIYIGRGTTVEVANGDFVKCMSIVKTAQGENKSLILMRGYRNQLEWGWHLNGFLTISGGSSCSY